jgi:hypothetical protein
MPTYSFRNTKTGEVFEKFMSISAKAEYLTQNPDLESLIGNPMVVTNSGSLKPDQGFRDVLKEIRSKHDKRYTRSTINTF